MKPSMWRRSSEERDCKKLRFAIYELRLTKSEIVNPKSEIEKSRSSVWLEHYTDNVGVSSSNLLGTTSLSSSKEVAVAVKSDTAAKNLPLKNKQHPKGD